MRHAHGATLSLGCIGSPRSVDGKVNQPTRDWQELHTSGFEPHLSVPREHYDKVLRDASQSGRLRRRKGVAFFLNLRDNAHSRHRLRSTNHTGRPGPTSRTVAAIVIAGSVILLPRRTVSQTRVICCRAPVN